jgi:hypothetical protein
MATLSNRAMQGGEGGESFWLLYQSNERERRLKWTRQLVNPGVALVCCACCREGERGVHQNSQFLGNRLFL